ncbi:MAG: hypothetical protein M1827_006659 [Pycnora praestabilis]|nr:MAG: hypothetical protein M1827_006659 [Pycnora praestabilis]
MDRFTDSLATALIDPFIIPDPPHPPRRRRPALIPQFSPLSMTDADDIFRTRLGEPIVPQLAPSTLSLATEIENVHLKAIPEVLVRFRTSLERPSKLRRGRPFEAKVCRRNFVPANEDAMNAACFDQTWQHINAKNQDLHLDLRYFCNNGKCTPGSSAFKNIPRCYTADMSPPENMIERLEGSRTRRCTPVVVHEEHHEKRISTKVILHSDEAYCRATWSKEM